MGEAPSPCVIVVPRRVAAHSFFRLPRHGRRKVQVVRLGGGPASGGRVRRHGRGFRLRRWLRRAAWRLAELCVAALSGQAYPGAPPMPSAAHHPPWNAVEPYFAAPFIPVARMKRAGAQA